MKVGVFGMGYVGVVTSACLARLGHEVIGVDVVKKKVEAIQSGNSPIVEPDVQELVTEGVQAGRLTATLSSHEALADADALIVCVGTPSRANGEVDTSSVLKVAEEIAAGLQKSQSEPVVIFRSTVPPGTMEEIVQPVFTQTMNGAPKRFHLMYHPEFLREGSAIEDFFTAPQVVAASVGGTLDHAQAAAFFNELYRDVDFAFQNVKVKTAEMIKYINNTFHALKVSYANEIGRICRSYGIDVHELSELFLADTKLNISPAYLRPGFAYGGSCLPKDLRALSKMASRADVKVPVISKIEESNKAHVELALDLILQSGYRKIGFLGLSFKSNTDDVRESPFLNLVERCIGKGLKVKIFDRCIDYTALTGRNRAFLHRHLEHITERLTETVEDTIGFAGLVVLSNPDQCYLEALHDLADREVLDLSGHFKQPDLSDRRLSIVLSEDGVSAQQPKEKFQVPSLT